MASAALDAALSYALHHRWYIIPCAANKHPLTPHGLKDASIDPDTIAGWWRRWPDARVAIVTGAISGLVVLDIDVKPEASGIDTLEALGVMHPETPTAHTPRGGVHCLFKHPGGGVPNSAGKIGPLLDVRGDGGYIVAPPGPGRYWDPVLDAEMPLADMPAWMVPTAPAPSPTRSARPQKRERLSAYAEKALDGAVEAIVSAPDGQQRSTLNREAYGIGQLVGGKVLPAPLALDALRWAAEQMRSHDQRHPWHAAKLREIVRDAFVDGQADPRGIPA